MNTGGADRPCRPLQFASFTWYLSDDGDDGISHLLPSASVRRMQDASFYHEKRPTDLSRRIVQQSE